MVSQQKFTETFPFITDPRIPAQPNKFKNKVVEIPPGGLLDTSASTKAWAQGLTPEYEGLWPHFLSPRHLRVEKNWFFLNSKLGLSVPTTIDCPQYSSCIHTTANAPFIGLHHLPEIWGKKPKATTKVTLTSHQIWENRMPVLFLHCLSAGFTAYLLSEECDLFDTDHRVVCQDMSQPLTHYFVASSHNTWVLTTSGRSPFGPSSSGPSTSGSNTSGRNKHFLFQHFRFLVLLL